MNSCCQTHPPENDHGHTHEKKSFDWMMWVCGALVLIPYVLSFSDFTFVHDNTWIKSYIHAVHSFVNTTWWGVALGILFLALLSRIPREFVMSVLGSKKNANGIARAMLAGVLLDLCSHGILMVGTKIYERGASIGQVMAFLIASPWNSISLTFILIAMVGFKLTMVFLVFSAVIAFISGLVFDALVKRGVLPENPNRFDLPEDFKFFQEAKKSLSGVQWSAAMFKNMLVDGLKDSAIVIRWLLFGIVVASLLRVFFSPEDFATFFGPTALGLGATLFFATILEVCSEGSSPIAADLATRANAPGNAFAFLMAGISTDYTEIMVIKETTRSWKIALFLPLVTLPQIILLAYFLNL